MDVLKAVIYIIVVMLGCDAISMMAEASGMYVITPYNSTQVTSGFDAAAVVDSWGWADNPFYDIATGLISFWTRTVPVIESFPAMLIAYGVPEFITLPFLTIWRFLWLAAVALGIIAGRQT
jgi:hypothetical protein